MNAADSIGAQPGTGVEGQRELGFVAIGLDVRARPIDVVAKDVLRKAQTKLRRHGHQAARLIHAGADASADEAPHRQRTCAAARDPGRVPTEGRKQDEAGDAFGLSMRERQRHRAAERLAAHEDGPRVGGGGGIEVLQSALGHTFHAALGQVVVVVEANGAPIWEEQVGGAQQHARVAVQARDDQHARRATALHVREIFYEVTTVAADLVTTPSLNGTALSPPPASGVQY